MTDSKSTSNVSRRNFLKTSAALAAGVATVGLASCSQGGSSAGGSSQGASSEAVSWDKTADVVVVGTGTAAIAAVAASDFGAESVIIIEKAEAFGGTTALSGGGVGIPLTHIAEAAGVEDSLEEVIKYYTSATRGRADVSVVENYVKNGDAFLLWAEEKFGFTYDFTMKMYQDYYEPCEGYLGFGRGNIGVVAIDGEVNAGHGGPAWNKVNEVIEADENIELIMGTEVTELIVDESGAVIGLVAGDLKIGANKGVVLGTGGFEHNDEMRQQYLPFPLLSTTSVTTNTGDGHRMGQQVGADLAYMDMNWGLPSFLVSGENAEELLQSGSVSVNFAGFDANTYRSLPGSCVVNKKGRRIGNECSAYAVFNQSLGSFDSGDPSASNLISYYICDSSVAGVYRLPGQQDASDEIPEFYAKGETIEELAEALGIDAASLAAEIAEFNEHAVEGLDPKFGRGSYEFDMYTDAVYAGPRDDLANPVLAPLATGPFYGIPIVPGTFGTSGGLLVNENSQVVSIEGEPIPGLYAVGNCSSGVSAGTYLHGGQTIGSGSVMSFVSARHILGVS